MLLVGCGGAVTLRLSRDQDKVKSTGKESCEPLRQYYEGDGPALFAAACKLGLEGIISKKADSPYRPGPKRATAWVKVKNKGAPGYLRFRDRLEG